CDWHKHYLLGDSTTELSPACHAKIEAEANYTSGQLVFMQERFVEELMGLPLSIDSLRQHSSTFGNSKATTLWRMVEEYQGAQAVVGIVSGHPRYPADDFDSLKPCRYSIQSSKFRSRFSNITEVQLFNTLKEYCGYQRGGALGTDGVVLLDDNGDRCEFVF